MRIEWPKDVSGFVRRQCPFCRRLFKTPWTCADALTFQRHLARVCPHSNEDEMAPEPGNLSCVYCSRAAPTDLFLTQPQREYVHGLARRLSEEVRFARLALVERTLSANPFPTFIPVAPSRDAPPLEDEPDDMQRLEFSCCGVAVKVERHWKAEPHCTQCGAKRSASKAGAHHTTAAGAAGPPPKLAGRLH